MALRESDLRAWSFFPDFPGLSTFSNMLCAVHEANGATVNAAARLVSWVLANGIKREHIEASAGTWVSTTALPLFLDRRLSLLE